MPYLGKPSDSQCYRAINVPALCQVDTPAHSEEEKKTERSRHCYGARLQKLGWKMSYKPF